MSASYIADYGRFARRVKLKKLESWRSRITDARLLARTNCSGIPLIESALQRRYSSLDAEGMNLDEREETGLAEHESRC